jgi:hypothetical protein
MRRDGGCCAAERYLCGFVFGFVFDFAGLVVPPMTSLNLGAATTSCTGSDHDICCAPVGSE